MFRSFLLFPLSLNIPGKGLFRKLIGESKTYNDRPVYNRNETAEVIFFKGDLVCKITKISNKNILLFIKTISGEAVEAVTMRMMGQTLDL